MWKDISLANKEAVLNDLRLFNNQIQELSRMIEEDNQAALEKYLQTASSTRKNWKHI